MDSQIVSTLTAACNLSPKRFRAEDDASPIQRAPKR
jgi:hypothetical protein